MDGSLSILEDVSDVKTPDDSKLEALLAFIDTTHPKSAELRKERILAALKGSRLIEDNKVTPDLLKLWQKKLDFLKHNI